MTKKDHKSPFTGQYLFVRSGVNKTKKQKRKHRVYQEAKTREDKIRKKKEDSTTMTGSCHMASVEKSLPRNCTRP